MHWCQGFTWRELCKYGLDQDLILSPNNDFPDYYKSTVKVDGQGHQPLLSNLLQWLTLSVVWQMRRG